MFAPTCVTKNHTSPRFDISVMIAEVYIVRRSKRRKLNLKRVLVMAYLLRFRQYLRDRIFIRSGALLSMVKESPWYVMYRNGQDSDLISATSLSRGSFDYLLSRFKDFY